MSSSTERKAGRPQSLSDVLLQTRMRTQEQVRERFARYGDPVCEKIRQAANHPNGLGRLLERLGLACTPRFDQQCYLLQRFLNDHGPQAFLNRLGERARTGRILIAEAPPSAELGAPPAQTKPRAATPPPNGAWPKHTPPNWFDAHGNYVGPERRSGEDRRTGKDRRGDIESIRKNRRYGGDRRKVVRRKEDRIKLGLEKPDPPQRKRQCG